MTGSRSMDRDFETRYLILHTRPDSEPQNVEVSFVPSFNIQSVFGGLHRRLVTELTGS
jgi:hypothetical protein